MKKYNHLFQQYTQRYFYQGPLLLIILWGILVCVNAMIRPLQPSNEMHHTSIAWEMWQHRHFLVPVQTGLPYAEKTPFLYWLIHLGWITFGVSTWWPRLLPQLFILGSVLMTRSFAKLLWPEHKNLTIIAPLIVLGTFVWSIQYHITWFDMLIIFFVLLSWYCLYAAIQQPSKKNWAYWALAIGLGLFAKGPVIFLFALSPAVLVKFWGEPHENWQNIYLSMLLAIFASILIFLCWAIPACIFGGAGYAHDLFLKQTLGRITGNHGGHSVWFFYFAIIPLLIFPWILWLRVWKGIWSYWQHRDNNKDLKNIIFLFSNILPPIFILSLFAAKSFGYLFPIIPIFAILMAFFLETNRYSIGHWDNLLIALFYLMMGFLFFAAPHFITPNLKTKYFWLAEFSPFWGCGFFALGIFWLWWTEKNLVRVVSALTMSSVICCVLFQLSIFHIVAKYNDWRNLSVRISQFEAQNIPVAFPNKDDAPEELFEFFGRLTQPIVVPQSQVQNWIKAHPNGWLVVKDRQVSPAQYDLYPASIFDDYKV